MDLVHFSGFGPPHTYAEQCQRKSTRTLFGKGKLAQFRLESQRFMWLVKYYLQCTMTRTISRLVLLRTEPETWQRPTEELRTHRMKIAKCIMNIFRQPAKVLAFTNDRGQTLFPPRILVRPDPIRGGTKSTATPVLLYAKILAHCRILEKFDNEWVVESNSIYNRSTEELYIPAMPLKYEGICEITNRNIIVAWTLGGLEKSSSGN